MIESGKGHKTNKNRVVLSLHEKARLIEESMNPGFEAKEAGVRYGININTVINIVKKKDQILGMVLIVILDRQLSFCQLLFNHQSFRANLTKANNLLENEAFLRIQSNMYDHIYIQLQQHHQLDFQQQAHNQD